MSKWNLKKVAIVGAGPAGLTAAAELLKKEKYQVILLEQDHAIGGFAKTVDFKGCKFDIGPHHYITDSPKIMRWWKDLMGEDFFHLKRFTRIYYKKHFFKYPLEMFNVLRGLSLFECLRGACSYFWAKFFPIKNVKSFEDWMRNRFGYRVYSIFFKTYTEKVWGISCKAISADWAAQRIQNFSLGQAIFYGLFGKFVKRNPHRTLKNDFYYPPQGSGVLWGKVAANVTKNDLGKIRLNEQVVQVEHQNDKITAFYTKSYSDNQKLKKYDADYFISSMPLQDLILAFIPKAPVRVRQAAKNLKYRGLITVNFIVDKKDISPDHWLYIHEKEVKMGRIGNMNNFSINMVDDPKHTALNLEYFTYTTDEFWNKSDQEILQIGKEELDKMGFVKSDLIKDGMVLRFPAAYPVYDENYASHLNIVLQYLSQFSNLSLMGRNGLHRYNNMDIAMLSAMQAVDSVEKQEKSIEEIRHLKDDLDKQKEAHFS